jgi:dipeptidyl aminopeptidase/acylaminoacyl peptidase
MLTRTVGRMLASCLVIGLVATVAPGQAGATFPGQNGKLVFERGGNIWTGSGSMYRDRWHERRLTSDGISRNPRWSPDGTRIVYNTATGEIWTMSPTGAEPRLVTTGRAYQPAWSPPMAGGKWIVFVKVPKGTPGDLWIVPARGGTPTRLTFDGATNCGDSWPSWAPDGMRIVYQRSPRRADGTCGPTQVVVLELATVRRHVIPIPKLDESGEPLWPVFLTAPDFTADGARVLFGYLVESDGCDEFLGWYDVVSGTSTVDEITYACEGGPSLLDAGPSPSGDTWLEKQEWDGGNVYIEYPCPTEPAGICYASSDVMRWNAPDVQPRP